MQGGAFGSFGGAFGGGQPSTGYGGGFGGTGSAGNAGFGGFGQQASSWGAAAPAQSHLLIAQYPQQPGQPLCSPGAAITCVSIMKDPGNKDPTPYAFACGSTAGDVSVGLLRPAPFPQLSLNLKTPILCISTALIRGLGKDQSEPKQFIIAGTMQGLFLIDTSGGAPKLIPDTYQDVVIHAEFCGGYILYSKMCFENGLPKRYVPPAARSQSSGFGSYRTVQPPAQSPQPDSPIAFQIEVLDTYGKHLATSPELPCNGLFSSEFNKQNSSYASYNSPALRFMVPLCQGTSAAKVFALKKGTSRGATHTLDEDTTESSKFPLEQPAYGQSQLGASAKTSAACGCFFSHQGKGAMIGYETGSARFFKLGSSSGSSLTSQSSHGSVTVNLGCRVPAMCYDADTKAMLYACGNEVVCRFAEGRNAGQDFTLLRVANVPGEIVAMSLFAKLLVVVLVNSDGYKASLFAAGAPGLAGGQFQGQPQAGQGFGFGNAWQTQQGMAGQPTPPGQLRPPAGQANQVAIQVYELKVEEKSASMYGQKEVIYPGLVPRQR